MNGCDEQEGEWFLQRCVCNDKMNIASFPVYVRCGDTIQSKRGLIGGQIFMIGFRA